MLSNYTYSKYGINKGYNDDIKLFAPYYFELVSTPNKIEDGYWEFKDCQVLLNSSYFVFSGGPTPPKNYWKKVYKNQKPFNERVDNKWYFIIYKDNSNNIKISKRINNNPNINVALPWSPSWIKVYRWDGTGEPNLPEIDKNGNITNWNLKQQNNINNDDEIKVTIKNNNISENPVYQLEANYFNWLSITNELETNNIPSLIPAEIKLSDREYGKYLTNLIVSNDKIEKYLNYFSQWYRLLYSKAVWTSMTKDLVEDNIKITFYKHEKLFILNQIEISGIWGYGNYDINIFIKKSNEKIIERKDINLELIQNIPIGTKASGKDRNTYLQLIENDTWYLYKNGIEDENSYSNIAVVNFLKQSNSIIFSYPLLEEKININNLELFNKNNEKLSLITLEI
ncbi:hypothetical protein [Spiroplasma endosymbiont of Seladonia tumulorum]|uniref:hypothetical protein n=1 Tax=Spiroplasma endosymbiont of Seladonia tumulorum TaxID=3066321 RepID=UPI0030CC5D5F